MPPIDEATTLEPKPQAAESRKPKSAASAAETRALAADLVAFTVDAASGRIVSVERVDDAGSRRELSAEDRIRLARTDAGATLRRLVEQAFEAGIDCVLGGTGADEAETTEDAELGRLLLQSLIARSSAKRLLQGEVLNRAVVGALIEYAASGGGGPPEGAVAH